jgi:WD40 repeat protein
MKTRRPPCLEWREKLALRHEDLSPGDQQALDAHLRTCDACAEALADYHFFEARLDALPPPAIKPLPRLSPHFFERASDAQIENAKTVSDKKVSTRPQQKPERRPNKAMTAIWRALSIAAILCLLLGAGVLFRAGYLSRLAAHPSGDTLLNLNQHTGPVNSVGWSPDGQKIATASSDGTVKVWNAQSGALICTFTNGDVVFALAWSPDSKYIAEGSGDDTVKTFNASSCSSIKTYSGHTNSVLGVAWSRNGDYLASASSDHTALVWQVATGETLITATFNDDYAATVAWSPVADELAIGSWDTTVQIWNVQTRTHVQRGPYTDAVNAVAWSPDGKYLAIGIQNGTVDVREVANWQEIGTYTQHTDGVDAVAWSPDGKYIASGSEDKDTSVRIWNPFAPGLPTLMVYTQHKNAVSSLAWSPDGKKIVSGSADDTARVWAITE